jgi:hypothetical protein
MQYLRWSWEIKCIIYIHKTARRRTYRVINHFLDNRTDPDYGRQDMIQCRFVDGYQSSEGNCSLYARCSRPLWYICVSMYIYIYIYIYIRLVLMCQHCHHVPCQVVIYKSWKASNGKSAEEGIAVHLYTPQRFCLSSNITLCLLLLYLGFRNWRNDAVQKLLYSCLLSKKRKN